MNFWQRCESFPPILVRLLARTKPHGPPMHSKEIAQRFGSNPFYVESLGAETSWHMVPFQMVQGFTAACHLDFCNTAQMRRLDNYLRAGATLAHLRNHDQWTTYWMPLLVRWRRAYPADVSKLKLHPPVKALLARLTPLLNINYQP
jgi:hypothetical protein